MNQTHKIVKAMQLATFAHNGQVRKYTNEPYIVHPFAVAGLVSAVTCDEAMICAALLHDVVEDTPTTIEDIRTTFGSDIANLVSDLTDISEPHHGNRKFRKEMDRIHTLKASSRAKTIKLADLIDNTKTITALDPDFAVVYMREKKKLMEVLTEGNSFLYELAQAQIDRYEEDYANQRKTKRERGGQKTGTTG